jgi:hypothetical protein
MWSSEEIDFLRSNYPDRGKLWCCEELGKTEGAVRSRAASMKLRINHDSDFFREFQARAANGKVGKKRPNQSAIMKDKHSKGMLNNFVNSMTPEEKSRHRIEWLKNNDHPKGMLGKSHTNDSKAAMSKGLKETFSKQTEDEISDRVFKMLKTKWSKGIMHTPRKGVSWKQGWREIGGIKKYYRSRWEANYARYLEFLKSNGDIIGWEHEPDVFWFEAIKRGVRSYLPDFKVTEKSGDIVYHEVKGWMDARSLTKIKRMAKYHPDVKLIVVESKQYKSIQRSVSSIIKDWE